MVRELLGAGAVFGIQIFQGGATIFILAPGAFFVLACLVALQNKLKEGKPEKKKATGCTEGGCASCSNAACGLGKAEGGKGA